MDESGQAGVEYVAVVAVVLALVAAAFGAAPDTAAQVPRAVAASFARGFCLVSGGDCLGEDGPRPCVVTSTERGREKRVFAAVARLADGRSVLLEQRSDGTVAVTVVRFDEAGAAVTGGPEVRLGRKGFKASLDAVVSGRAGDGRRWVLPDRAAAGRLLERLSGEDGDLGGGIGGIARFLAGREGDADQRFVHFGARGEAIGTLRALGMGANGTAILDLASGVRVDRRTGERTFFLSRDRALVAELRGPLTRATGGLARDGTVELTLDRRNRPVALVVRASGAAEGALKLGPFAAAGGDRVEAEARLDLADPAVRALAGELLRRPSPGVARALVARFADRARLDVRAYATTHDETTKGAALGFVVKAGYEQIRTVDTARLVAAAGREPGLGWSRRLDCVVAA